MFGSTNNKSQYNFETTSTTPFQQQLHNETRTPNTTLNNLIGRKLIDTSLYSTDYSTTEDGSTTASVFYTPHSNFKQQVDVLKKNSCPQQNPPILNNSKFAQAPFGISSSFNNTELRQSKSSATSEISNINQTSGGNSLLLRAISQKYSPNVAANTVTFISNNNTTASTEDLEDDDCFGSPTTPSSYHQQYEVMTDSATPVSKLSTSTISKKSPLLTDDYSSHQSTNKSTTTTRSNTLSSGRIKSSETLSSEKSWSKSKACHSFKINTPYLNDKNHLNDNYSCSYVREDNFMANHHFQRTSGHSNNREKKAIFELSVNEEDLRILEDGVPYQNNHSNTSWFNNTIQPQQFSNNNKEEKIQSANQTLFFKIPQRDQGNFTKSQIETDKLYNPSTITTLCNKDSDAITNDENNMNRFEKIHTEHCDPSHQIDSARCVPKNSTFEINLDGQRSCTSSSTCDFKSCMEVIENAKFQPFEKKQTSSHCNTSAAVFCSTSIINTHTAETGFENNLLADCTFLPSPILPKESVKSNNTSTLHIIDHSLLFDREEETKSIDKQALVKPDINIIESTQDKMLQAVSIRNEVNHYPNQLQFVRMPIGGGIKPRQQPSQEQQQIVTLKKVTTTPKKNIRQEINRPSAISELACSFKDRDGFYMNQSTSMLLQQDDMDIDDCEEFEKNKQRFKNKFIKRRAKLLLNSEQVNIITARTLSENLRIVTEKACLLQKLKLQLEEKTLSIQSVCDRILHEDLSWQLEDIIAESTNFWSACDQVNTTSPSSVIQFLNKVCESENEIINAIEDLIDFVITSAKRMCKKHSLNINIILDTIRESATIELSNTRSYSQLKSASKQQHRSSTTTKPSTIKNISSNFSISSISSTTSEYSLYSSKPTKNVTNFEHNTPPETLEQVFDIKKRSELFETIDNNVDTVLDICSAIRHYASDEKMEALDTTFEEKFSAYCKILDEMKNYSGIDFDMSLSGASDTYSVSFY